MTALRNGLCLICGIVGVLAGGLTSAAWQPIGSAGVEPPGLMVWDPTQKDTVYLSTRVATGESPHILEKSTDGGVSWQGVPLPIGANGIGGMGRDPASKTLVVLGSGIFARTSDDGATWYAIPTVNPYGVPINRDPKNKRSLWISDGGSMYESANGGSAWKQVSSKTPTQVPDPDSGGPQLDALPSQAIYGLNNSYVLRSLNGGGSFAPVYQTTYPSSPAALAVAPTSGDLYVSQIDNTQQQPTTLITSSDRGVTWSVLNSGIRAGDIIRTLQVDLRDQRTVYAGGSPALGGCALYVLMHQKTWKCAGSSVPSDVWGFASSPIGGGTIAYGQGGMFKTTNSGKTWSMLAGANLQGASISQILSEKSGSVLYAESDQGIFRSADGGVRWTSLNAKLPDGFFQNFGCSYSCISSFAVDDISSPSRLYLFNSTNIYLSTDEGKNFSKVPPLPVTKISCASSDPLELKITGVFIDKGKAGRLFAVYGIGNSFQNCTKNFVSESEDYGLHWHYDTFPDRSDTISSITGALRSQNVIYVSGGQGFYKTTNGKTYQEIAVGYYPTDFLVLGTTPTALLFPDPYITNTLDKTTDDGRSIERVSTPFSETSLFSSPNGDKIFATAQADRYSPIVLWVSSDGAKSWTEVTADFTLRDANAVWPTGSNVIVQADDGSLFRRSYDDLTAAPEALGLRTPPEGESRTLTLVRQH